MLHLIYRNSKEPLFIGFERDKRMIVKAIEYLKNNQIEAVLLNQRFNEKINKNIITTSGFYIINQRFSKVNEFVNQLEKKVDFLICDLGISMFHLKEDWGFSMKNNHLDMRLDEESLNLLEILNTYKEEDLANIIYQYGEERYSKYIAKEIVKKRPIQSATILKDIIINVYYKKLKKHINEKVVQRTFQAFRIYINKELEELEILLKHLKNILSRDGIAVFISFHSLEDRIIKHAFKDLKNKGFSILTKKPLTSSTR
ncbi:MAG: ribosomal RNA small subunit methyltransferase H [Leptospiraceae bacterium]|nr:MAG: ribosomal RNA small subunit methyltransferase H [Leptospiraceae bacterium]